jgi:superfamily II DNA/RNA helicase
MLFTELPLCNTLLDGLQAMNFKETTPVQEQAIPVILDKKDVIACAQTGTGKTAAFLLPLLNNLQTDAHDENKINAIIMAPTRELAQQIDQHMEGFSYFTPFSSVAVYGGNDGDAWDVQKRGLLSGADVVIATPGRLLSHINLYKIDFSGVKYFILDEADRMLDMGFQDDIMKIEKLLPKKRQTIMFSATMPPKIQQLAKTILDDPKEITIAIARPPETILQSAYICYEGQKINIVKNLFKEKKPNKVILFSGSKQKVKEIANTLKRMGLSSGEMHSDLDQSQRDHVMHEFKNERVDILVATDIVARGIDIDDISLVINFDVPYDAEDYVHRIGRTARAGDSGMAITFVSPAEQYRFSQIEKFLQKEIYRIPVPSEFGDTPEYNPVKESKKRYSPKNTSGRSKKKNRSTPSTKEVDKVSNLTRKKDRRGVGNNISTRATGETGKATNLSRNKKRKGVDSMNSTGASQSSGSSPEISFEKGKSGSAQDGRPEKNLSVAGRASGKRRSGSGQGRTTENNASPNGRASGKKINRKSSVTSVTNVSSERITDSGKKTIQKKRGSTSIRTGKTDLRIERPNKRTDRPDLKTPLEKEIKNETSSGTPAKLATIIKGWFRKKKK